MDVDAIRHTLEERLGTLERRLQKIEGHLRDPGSKDSQEHASETENDEVYERLDEAERSELQDLRRALARLDAGQYTVCASCSGPIAPRRLEALPYTSVCVACAR